MIHHVSISAREPLHVAEVLAEIERIGAREGWRTRLFGRGAPGQKPSFHVIEFWVENRLMIELAPEAMIGEYTEVMAPAAVEKHFAARADA